MRLTALVHVHAPRKGGLRLLLAAVTLALILLTFTTGHAKAVGCSGNECLPGIGYTFEAVWNCGQIHSETRCWYKEVTSQSRATSHTWGFGSASYSGEGSDTVEVAAYNGSFVVFGAVGTNLARSCYEEFCNDQSLVLLTMEVDNSGFHTISGHGEA
jgi:hypothetical protein